MSHTVKPTTVREDLLIAYGELFAVRHAQIQACGRLILSLDRLPPEERGDIEALLNATEEATRKLTRALARKLEL